MRDDEFAAIKAAKKAAKLAKNAGKESKESPSHLKKREQKEADVDDSKRLKTDNSGAEEVAHALSAASEAEREEAQLLARLEAVRASKEAAHARAAAAKLSSDGNSVEHAESKVADAPPPAEAMPASAASAPAADMSSSFTDQWKVCSECGADFNFSASEQRFFYEKGFSAKHRCSECTAAKKSRFGEESGKGTAAKERAAKTTCYVCGIVGHSSKECRQAPCYNCGMKGHKSKDCKEPRDNKAGGGTCFKFQSGSCTRGDTCRFAHVLDK